MLTQIRLLLEEQSDLDLHCLNKRLLKQLGRQQKQTSFVVIGILFVLFDLILYVPVNNFSVMLGLGFLG